MQDFCSQPVGDDDQNRYRPDGKAVQPRRQRHQCGGIGSRARHCARSDVGAWWQTRDRFRGRGGYMRISIIIATLICWCAPAASMTIELERRFGSQLATEEFTILSSTDIELFAPVIEEFVAKRPNIAIHYVLASSRDIYSAIDTERAAYDLVISSAMDLQMKLVNDGNAGRFESPVTASLPDWAKWRDQLFGFAVEPIVLVVSRRDFAALPTPTSRRHFLSIIRSNSATFRNRMMTYDVNISGTGFLFATQDARQSDTFWRLSEVMGAMGTRLSCCSGEMLARIESGEIAAAAQTAACASSWPRVLPEQT